MTKPEIQNTSSKLRKWLITATVLISSLTFIVIQLNQFAHDASLNNWNSGFEGYINSSRWQQNTKKPIALFFYTDWCSNCKKLREEILSDQSVDAYLKALMPVKINPELGPLEDKLAQEFGVFAYPSVFIMPADGSESIPIRRTSNISPNEFIAQLEQAIKN